MIYSQEQNQIIQHNLTEHARVIAVAGSGKTSTMVARVQYLLSQGIPDSQIRILVYNRLARVDFQNKLAESHLYSLKNKVHTFHSLAFALWKKIPKEMNPFFDWELVGDDSSTWITLAKIACEQSEEKLDLKQGTLSHDLLLSEIALWKGKSITPKESSHSKEGMTTAYAKFENLRQNKKLLSFDDLITVAIEICQVNSVFNNKIEHLIVDEAQDMNEAQKLLLQSIAGTRAKLMLIGDDDQSIYTWRGSNSDYLIGENLQGFSKQPWNTYSLSGTYRLGNQIASFAQNILSYNQSNFPKQFNVMRPRDVQFKVWQGSYQYPSNQHLLDELLKHYQSQKSWKGVVVLGRLYSQFTEFESLLLRKRIAYHVEGGQKILDRLPFQILHSYTIIAQYLKSSANTVPLDLLRTVLMTPKKYFAKVWTDVFIQDLKKSDMTLHEILRKHTDHRFLSQFQKSNLKMLMSILYDLYSNQETTASKVLNQLVKKIDLYHYFREEWGNSPTGQDHISSLKGILAYAHSLNLSFEEFFKHVQDLKNNPPLEEPLLLTTIHRTKGLEWDLVVIPKCQEGYLPYYDLKEKTQIAKKDLIEERRLFYVAITRVKEKLWIGIDPEQKSPSGHSWGDPPSRFLYESKCLDKM